MALIIKAIVETKTKDVLIIVTIRIHLTKNLAKGGIPAKLAVINSSNHFFTFLLASMFNTFILKFFIRYIIIITDIQ